MSFNNSIYKAYLDLATYGPIEKAMYVREWFGKRTRVKPIFLLFVILIIFLLKTFLK